MSILFFMRFLLPAIMLVGWLFYQAIIKKRKWKKLQNDVLAVAFFVSVCASLSFFFID